jgi:ankyrin repeat protein
MPLHSLPPEIIFLIAEHLTSVSDLFNFLRANRQLFHLLFSQIYLKNIKVDGGSALIWYAIHGNEEGVGAMLGAGADVNGRSSNGAQSTALLEAVIHNHEPVVRLLLYNGASPDLADVRGRRPLTVAATMRNDATITTILLKHHAKVDAIPCERRAPLMEAVWSNQASKVALLLEHGAKWDIAVICM